MFPRLSYFEKIGGMGRTDRQTDGRTDTVQLYAIGLLERAT